jgi:pentatricopeptide repeat protein
MQLKMIQSDKAGQKTFGPALVLLMGLLAIEALLGIAGITVQYAEIWVVLVMVPLGYMLIQQPNKHRSGAISKKVIDDDGAQNVSSKSVSKQKVHGRSAAQDTSGRSQPRAEKPDTAKAAQRTDEKANIETCVKAKDLKGAEACLTRLAENSNEDAVCYNMVISLCGKLGEVTQAHLWMQRMLDAGVRPDVASFNSTIDACARCGDIKGAEHWLRRMEAVGLSANTMTYNTVINACAQASDIPRAQWWMSQLCTHGTADVVSYTSVINACAKQGDVHGAEEWLRKMIQAGLMPTSYHTVL